MVIVPDQNDGNRWRHEDVLEAAPTKFKPRKLSQLKSRRRFEQSDDGHLIPPDACPGWLCDDAKTIAGLTKSFLSERLVYRLQVPLGALFLNSETENMNPPLTDATQEDRLNLCLDGLSLGDAFGEMFFGAPFSARDAVRTNRLPSGTWWYTDDTEMALAIAEVLKLKNEIDQDLLAERFAVRFLEKPDCGYGKGTRAFCEWLNRGVSWQQAAALTFKGGSKGNGSAMRVAPVGAYLAEAELSLIEREAQKSAEVTHRHPEGVAGAIAIAMAAVAWQMREASTESAAKAIFGALLSHVPDSETLQGIRKASEFDFKAAPEHAAKILGNGTLVTCPDTVPYVIWSACRNLDNYTEAILDTLTGGGDTDTNCAMVGGIVALYASRESIPALWLERREPLKWSSNADR